MRNLATEQDPADHLQELSKSFNLISKIAEDKQNFNKFYKFFGKNIKLGICGSQQLSHL